MRIQQKRIMYALQIDVLIGSHPLATGKEPGMTFGPYHSLYVEYIGDGSSPPILTNDIEYTYIPRYRFKFF